MNVQNNLPATTQVKFHDDTLITIQQHGKVYVAIKPVCQTLGLRLESSIQPNPKRPRLIDLYGHYDHSDTK